GV
ncbi:unnamed protein product, partial [Arabidopsis lyrata]